MINELFTIYDKVAQEAGPIFQAKNLYVAMRYVKDMIKDNNINLTEYDLVRLGTFDSESMSLVALSKCDAVELSNCVTYVDDANEFMKVNATEEDFNEFKKEYDVKEVD